MLLTNCIFLSYLYIIFAFDQKIPAFEFLYKDCPF